MFVGMHYYTFFVITWIAHILLILGTLLLTTILFTWLSQQERHSPASISVVSATHTITKTETFLNVNNVIFFFFLALRLLWLKPHNAEFCPICPT